MSNTIKHMYLYLIITSITLVSLAACNSDNSGNSYGKGSSADLLKMAANNMKNAKSYHIEVDSSTGPRVSLISGDIDTVSDNSKLNLSENNVTRIFISIGEENYISTDEGKTFTKDVQSLASMVDQINGIWRNADTTELDKNKDVLKDGIPAVDVLDGVSYRHIVIIAQDFPSLNLGANLEGTYDIWVAIDGSSVKQLKAVGRINGENLTLTIEWSNINGIMNITAPSSAN